MASLFNAESRLDIGRVIAFEDTRTVIYRIEHADAQETIGKETRQSKMKKLGKNKDVSRQVFVAV